MTTFVLCNECGNRWKVSLLSLTLSSIWRLFLRYVLMSDAFVISFSKFQFCWCLPSETTIIFWAFLNCKFFIMGGKGVYKRLQLVIFFRNSYILTLFTWIFEIFKHVLIIRVCFIWNWRLSMNVSLMTKSLNQPNWNNISNNHGAVMMEKLS